MSRLPLARSLRLALVGLTVLLAAVAALGVASLYNARQRYEDTLARTSALATTSANLLTAGVLAQQLVRVHAASPGGAAAASGLSTTAAAARALAAGDPGSGTLAEQQVAAELRAVSLAARRGGGAARAAVAALAGARTDAERLQARQLARQAQARATARARSRRAVLAVAIAGALALLCALALVSVLVAGLRRPLEELVAATRDLAAGDLDRRVAPSGPRELRALADAFNAMGERLAEAQRRLQQERHRLAVTIESLGDGLIVTEPGSSVVAAVNPRATELVPELAVGAAVDGQESPLPPLERALAGEAMIEHAGRTLAVTAARLGAAGDAGVVWTVRDTTERARLERAKSEFVATASHELRSPLTSIKGFVELLHRAPEGMSERQREFVEIILKSTERLAELVSDLLDVARIEADRVEIRRRPIDVGEAVREAAELMLPQVEQKRQQLSVHVAPTVPMAMADAGRVRQIVANLLTNAHLYTGEGGSIDVKVDSDRAWVRIQVRDTGVGLTREQAQRVFERFYRARDGGSGGGTGLGLSIVKSLVELHGGQVDVDSEPGRGTTFRVLLPVAALETPPREAIEAIRGRRVLVVDDEREIAELIVGQLAPLGVSTEMATSGAQALQMLRESHFDAVTLDVLMPGMDGFEVLRQIRADPSLRTTPIVFVSVFSNTMELAGEWVVPKPIDADELRLVLGAAVQAGRSRVLVVARDELRATLEPALAELGIEYQWEDTGVAAARVCAERRFEIALVDAGVRNPQAVLQALNLRGRRLRRAAILVSDDHTPAPAGIDRLGLEVVPIERAAPAVLAALSGGRAVASTASGQAAQ
jgi:signal transduction histidine kinase/CheY-like chemotaxis protein